MGRLSTTECTYLPGLAEFFELHLILNQDTVWYSSWIHLRVFQLGYASFGLVWLFFMSFSGVIYPDSAPIHWIMGTFV